MFPEQLVRSGDKNDEIILQLSFDHHENNINMLLVSAILLSSVGQLQ